jgi:hypothetical protein
MAGQVWKTTLKEPDKRLPCGESSRYGNAAASWDTLPPAEQHLIRRSIFPALLPNAAVPGPGSVLSGLWRLRSRQLRLSAFGVLPGIFPPIGWKRDRKRKLRADGKVTAHVLDGLSWLLPAFTFIVHQSNPLGDASWGEFYFERFRGSAGCRESLFKIRRHRGTRVAARCWVAMQDISESGDSLRHKLGSQGACNG